MPDLKEPTYSEYYGIKDETLPFLNLPVYNDTPLFLDPHRIRMATGPEPFRAAAVLAHDSYLRTLGDLVLAGAMDARDILQHISEPKETRLGMSVAGCHGHAANEILGQMIWYAVSNDLQAFWHLGILRHLEDLPIFVKRIGDDVMSDIATRVAFEALAEFTVACMREYPELRSKGTTVKSYWVWDSSSCAWAMKQYELPIIDGIAVILVPTGWVGASVLGNAGRFFYLKVLDYKREPLMCPWPSKRELARQITGERASVNREVTLEALRTANIPLLEQYWLHIDEFENRKIGLNA